jgi:glycosyltransferase involved in cell wall biosynthesis
MKISIVTPSFNQAGHLGETLLSVQKQGISELEHIVIDGGSNDESLEIIQSYAEGLAYWCSEPDGGQYQAINKGFEKSTGEIMGWLNSSDLYMPWTLKTVEEIFSKFPDIDWISSLPKVCINEDGTYGGLNEMPGFSARRFSKGLLGGATNNDFIQQETCFWRRSLWDKIGGRITDRYRYAADFWLWAEFFKHTRCTGVDVPLAAFRFHGDQRSGENRYRKEVIEVIREIQDPCVLGKLSQGYQNLVRQWVVSSSGMGGIPSWKLVTGQDDRFLSIYKFWSDFARQARWTASSLTYLPIAAWNYAKRGFRKYNKYN